MKEEKTHLSKCTVPGAKDIRTIQILVVAADESSRCPGLKLLSPALGDEEGESCIPCPM